MEVADIIAEKAKMDNVVNIFYHGAAAENLYR